MTTEQGLGHANLECSPASLGSVAISAQVAAGLSLEILREERQHFLFDTLDYAIGVIAVVGFEGMRDAEVGEDLIQLSVRRGQSVLRSDLAHDRAVLFQVGDVLVDHRQW